MRLQPLAQAVLRDASLLVPSDQRPAWLIAWRSELWYVPRRDPTFFSMGAFPDALWLRRNNPSQVKRTRPYLESPHSCIAFLAMLATVSSVVVTLLPGPPRGPWPSHWRVS